MLTVPKIRAAIYAIRKHYFSSDYYQLLQNPKGVSGENVHLIKYVNTIDPESLDIYETRTSIIKNFSFKNPKVCKETFEKIVYRFFNSNFKMTGTRIFRKFEKKDARGVNVEIVAKGDRLTNSQKDKRNTSHLHEKNITIEEVFPNPSLMPQEHPYLYSTHREVSYAQKVVEDFYTEIFNNQQSNPFSRKLSFWGALNYNLSQ